MIFFFFKKLTILTRKRNHIWVASPLIRDLCEQAILIEMIAGETNR